jgi:asparagine synthase (glutamine-hydrolysing)
MANFVIVADRDERRRTAFLSAIRERIAPLPGLVQGEAGSGPVRVAWAAGPRAPLSVTSEPAGGAVVWGDAIGAGTARRATAADVRHAWGDPGPAAAWDGFHAAVRWDAAAVTVGADILGLFPVYWWSDGQVVLVGSSPELFRHHARCQATLDHEGLVGILLTNGLVGGRTVWSGVRRLSPGHTLRWDERTPPREEVQYEIPVSHHAADLPFHAQVHALGDVLKDAVARHAPRVHPAAMLLSGGLDSRMLAGFLAENGNDIHALTLGSPADLEMRCARRVAAFLAFTHRGLEIDPRRYPDLADTTARWKHLASGFCGLSDWSVAESLGTMPAHTVAGYASDGVVGGIHVDWGYDEASRSWRFEKLLHIINRWGLSPDDIHGLLPDPLFQSAVREVVATLEREYLASAALESHRAWLFDLRHRQRFHVGSSLWGISFGSWPVLPATLDRAVIAFSAGLPAASLAGRRLQRELVMVRFPGLAALPLDQNAPNPRPLRPRLRWLMAEAAGIRLATAASLARRLVGARPPERRHFFRTYALDGPGWRAVREHAEPARAMLRGIMDPAQVARVWPPPSVTCPIGDTLANTSAPKLLMGVALLARDHPTAFAAAAE